MGLRSGDSIRAVYTIVSAQDHAVGYRKLLRHGELPRGRNAVRRANRGDLEWLRSKITLREERSCACSARRLPWRSHLDWRAAPIPPQSDRGTSKATSISWAFPGTTRQESTR